MRHLLIIGARGFGREIYNHFLHCKEILGDVECKGFLDDNKEALEKFEGYPPIISSVEEYEPMDNDVFICALGDPKWIKHYAEIIESKGGRFISLISPLSSISSNTIIGEGCIISKWVGISNDVKIGRHTTIDVFSDLGHDVQVGDFCHLGAYTFMGGYSKIGNQVTIHPRANILPHKTIGSESVVGAGSIVIRNVPEKITVFGNPAKRI